METCCFRDFFHFRCTIPEQSGTYQGVNRVGKLTATHSAIFCSTRTKIKSRLQVNDGLEDEQQACNDLFREREDIQKKNF